jgi:hypothetical protein
MLNITNNTFGINGKTPSFQDLKIGVHSIPVVKTTGYTPFPFQGNKLLQTDFQYPFDITA